MQKIVFQNEDKIERVEDQEKYQIACWPRRHPKCGRAFRTLLLVLVFNGSFLSVCLHASNDFDCRLRSNSLESSLDDTWLQEMRELECVKDSMPSSTSDASNSWIIQGIRHRYFWIFLPLALMKQHRYFEVIIVS